jgi:hypothetical protein
LSAAFILSGESTLTLGISDLRPNQALGSLLVPLFPRTWTKPSRPLLPGHGGLLRGFLSKVPTPVSATPPKIGHLCTLQQRAGTREKLHFLLKYKHTGWFADDGITPLHLAASYGRTAAVKQITRIPGHDWKREGAIAPEAIQKIQASISNKSGHKLEAFLAKTFSARELAVIYAHIKTVLAFSSRHDDDIFHAVSCACMLGDVHAVEVLRNHHNETQWFFEKHTRWTELPGSQVRWFPAPPLHFAVMSGNRCLNQA